MIELGAASEPFATAHLTALNLTMADGFLISLLGGAADISVPMNGADVFFREVGPMGTVTQPISLTNWTISLLCPGWQLWNHYLAMT